MSLTLDMPEGAAGLAEALLSPLGDRWLRTQAVAARARDVAWTVSRDERDLLEAAAWLHDIGCATKLRRTGFHPLDGARYLAESGAPERLVRLVAHHSGAVYEAERRGLSEELSAYEREDSPLLDALVFADMATGPTGEAVDFAERTNEILGRCAPQAHAYLTEAVDRTWRRYAVSASLRPSQRATIDGSGWWPPTCFAAEHQDADLMSHLLDAGADPDEGSDITPLTHAIESEGDASLQSGEPLSVVTTAVLLAYGANPGLPDGSGDTPLAVAERYDHTLAITLLRRHLRSRT